MDLSIEAIENDLNQAEARAGNPVAAVHLARAQVRATLIAAGYGEPVIDRTPTPEPVAVEVPTLLEQDDQLIVGVEDDEVDADFFGEARKSRKK